MSDLLASMKAQIRPAPAPAPAPAPEPMPRPQPQQTPGLPERPDALGRDILACVHRLICDHICAEPGLPALAPDQVLRGNQTSMFAPAGDEYCIFYEVNHVTHGTPGRHFPGDNTKKIGQLLHYTVQCDFYSTDLHGDFIKARERAHIMELLANNGDLAWILKQYSPVLSCLYADPATSLTELNDGQNFQHRYSVNLHVSEYKMHSVKQAYFDSVGLHLTNVNSMKTEG